MWPYLIGLYIPAMLVMQTTWLIYFWTNWGITLPHPEVSGDETTPECSGSTVPHNNVVYLQKACIPPTLRTQARFLQPSESNVIPLPPPAIRR